MHEVDEYTNFGIFYLLIGKYFIQKKQTGSKSKLNPFQDKKIASEIHLFF